MRAGYRLFAHDGIAVLRFIRQAKTLGLTLAEISDIHSLQRGGAQPCGRVTPLLDTHIDRTLAELRHCAAPCSRPAARRPGPPVRR